MTLIKNIGGVAHRYEHRATRTFYVFPVGEKREVPDDVAAIVVNGHPNKLRYIHPDGSLEVFSYVEPLEPEEPIVNDEGARTDARGASDRMVHPPGAAVSHPGLGHAWRADGFCRCGAAKPE